MRRIEKSSELTLTGNFDKRDHRATIKLKGKNKFKIEAWLVWQSGSFF